MMKIFPLLLLLVWCISNVDGDYRNEASPRRSKEERPTSRRNRYRRRRLEKRSNYNPSKNANNGEGWQYSDPVHIQIHGSDFNSRTSSGASDKININRDIEIPNNDKNPSPQAWTIELSLPWIIGIGSVIISSLLCNIICVYINCCSKKANKYTSAKQISDFDAEEITE